MTLFFKRHGLIFVLAFLVGSLIVFPNIFAVNRLGSDFKGIFPAFNDDEFHYLGMIREAYDGHYGLGNVFSGEHKDAPSLTQPLAPIIFAFFAKVFNLSIPATMAINDFISPFAGVLLLYLLLFGLFESMVIAGGFSVLYYLFFISLFSRPVNPQFSFLFFYLGLFFIWKIISDKEITLRRLALFNFGLAVVFGIVFYIYPFVWTSILAVYGLALLFLILKERRVVFYLKGLLFFATPVALAAIPYILNLKRAIADPNYLDTFLRFGFILNRYPSAFLNVALIMSGLAIIYLVGKNADSRKKIFVYSLALGGVALNWQNVITGKILSFSPHYYTTIVLFLFIIFAFCVSMIWKNYKENILNAGNYLEVILMAALLIFVFDHTGGQNWIGYRNSLLVKPGDIAELRELQKLSGLADWFNKNSSKDSVVYSMSNNCDWFVPTYTYNNVYYHCNDGLFLASDDELENKWVIQNFFTEGITGDYIERENMSIWTSKFIERYQNEAVRNKILNFLKIKKDIPASVLVPEEYIDRVLQKVDFYQKMGFEKALKQYTVNYILLYANNDEYSDQAAKLRTYSFLKLVADIEDNLVFEVRHE